MFPLEQWFDTTQPICKADADITEAPMLLYAVKKGWDPESAEVRKKYRAMRKAVKEHNQKFLQ